MSLQDFLHFLDSDYGISIDDSWDAACEKVERRTPYMAEWGDGHSTANSVEEAKALWQAVKKKEKSEIKENESRSLSLRCNLKVVTMKDTILWNFTSYSVASSLLLGFVVGVLVTKKGFV
jgi:hypothetical protein